MKFCKDCKHFEEGKAQEHNDRCVINVHTVTEPVRGMTSTVGYVDCSTAREARGTCGPLARYWEAR